MPKTKVTSKVKPWKCEICGKKFHFSDKSKKVHLKTELEEIEDSLSMYEVLERIVYSEMAKLTPLKKK